MPHGIEQLIEDGGRWCLDHVPILSQVPFSRRVFVGSAPRTVVSDSADRGDGPPSGPYKIQFKPRRSLT